MNRRLVFCLTLAVLGVLWIAVVRSDRFVDWLATRQSEHQDTPAPYKITPDPDFEKKYKVQKTLKAPWKDSKVVLLRPDGQTVELNAKKAVYSILITKMPDDHRPHKSFDSPFVAFIDPDTRNVWVGAVDPGEVDSNEGFPISPTNFYFEASSGIFAAYNIMFQGTFECEDSLIGQAMPGEDLNEVIGRFDQLKDNPFGHGWDVPLGDYFRGGFFSKRDNDDWPMDTEIKDEKMSRGELRLDFNSLEYGTTGSVWLDWKTFEVRHAVEYRLVQFNLATLWQGLAPALAAILTAGWAVFTMRKARQPFHYILGMVVLMVETRALFLLCNVYIPGAWPTYISFFRYVFVLGDWAVYVPMIYVGLGFLIVAMQAFLLQNRKRL